MADEHLTPWNQVTLHGDASPSEGRAGLCVGPDGSRTPLLLVDLIHAGHATVASELDHLHASADGMHSHLLVHINPGPVLGHDGCLTAPACVSCSSDLLQLISTHEAGTLRLHITSDGSPNQEVLCGILEEVGYDLSVPAVRIPWTLHDPVQVRTDIALATAALTR